MTDATTPDQDPLGSPPSEQRPSDPLPPDPVAYDSPRATLARQRGLSAPYIAGGRDADPVAGQRQERFYGRLLVIMVIALVLAGFVLGIVDKLLTGSGAG